MGRGKNWLRADEDVLTAAWEEGQTVAEIAETLGKTSDAVRGRASKLGLSVSRRDEVVREALELRAGVLDVLERNAELMECTRANQDPEGGLAFAARAGFAMSEAMGLLEALDELAALVTADTGRHESRLRANLRGPRQVAV